MTTIMGHRSNEKKTLRDIYDVLIPSEQ